MLKLGHLLVPSITWQGGGRMLSATTVLTNAQVLAVRAVAIEVAPAPVAGSFLRLLRSTIIVDATAGVYVETDDNLAIRYTDESGIVVSEAIQSTALITTADIMTGQIEPIADAIVTDAGSLAQNLVIHNTGSGEITGGNAANTIKVILNFLVIKA